MDVHVGVLEASDWPDVAAIYTQGIETGDATFETAPPEWSEWDSTHHDDCRLVARVDGDIAGWAALSPVRPVRLRRRGRDQRVRGVRDAGEGRGRRVATTSRGGVRGGRHLDVGGRRVSGERSSVRLHLSQGFRIVGVRERLGRSHGTWRDVLLLERRSSAVGT
jgi:L-amino acid N-acyltransferase YncA